MSNLPSLDRIKNSMTEAELRQWTHLDREVSRLWRKHWVTLLYNRGYSNVAIAKILGIAESTVRKDLPTEIYVIKRNTKDAELFGRLVRSYRVRANKTVDEVADLCSLTPSFIRAIERGAQTPAKTTFGRIIGMLVKSEEIKWVDDEAYDLILTDPITNKKLRFVFSAEVRGQNKRQARD